MALVVLMFINTLNFVDRYVISSVKELIKDDLHLSDTVRGRKVGCLLHPPFPTFTAFTARLYME